MAIKKEELSKPIAQALLEKLRDVGISDVAELISEDEELEQVYDQDYIDKLKLCFQSFSEKTIFEKGQIVRWKHCMQNKKLPKVNQPAIVIETLSEPIFEVKVPIGSTYYREPLDIVLGLFHNDGSFLTFYHDSRRFELYPDSKK